MKKSVILILLVCILLSSLVFADTNSTAVSDDTAVSKAYDCLKAKVASQNSCKGLSAEEQSFALLALAYDADSQRNCKTALKENSKDNTCWPSSGCTIKATAQAILGLNYVRSDTKQAEEYLLAQNATPTDLLWYLQIDTNEASTCTISYDGIEKSVYLGSDKKLNGDAGGCLTRAQDDYWLKISSSCYNKKFTVSCDKQFLTSLLYKRQNFPTVFISSKTSSASAKGQTEETVSVKCFKQGNVCDYEGSLWAALALSKAGRDITEFLPYLTATAGDNEKYFPDSILYTLTNEDLYFSNMLSQTYLTPMKYWQATNSPYNKFYDSSLGIMALYSSSSQELEDAKNYFLSIASNDGCWQGTRDTAFLLFAGWPKSAANVADQTSCTQSGYYCITSGSCLSSGGNVKSNYYCPSVSNVCCSSAAVEESCAQKGGKACGTDEACSTTPVSSSDSLRCCLGTCEKVEVYTCTNCASSCGSDETELSSGGTCPLNQMCCGPAGKSYWWVWLLVILVILAALAIVFRNKLKEYWFRFGIKSSKPPAQQPPQSPPQGLRMPMQQRPGFPPMPPRGFPQRPAPAQPKSSEFDDTIKKLKDMSK